MTASPIHKASLVDASLHSPALMELIELDMGRTLIEHVVDTVVETVDYALGRPSSSTRGRSTSRHTENAPFTKFVTDVVTRAEVKVPALLVTLVYIDRAKPHIQIALEQWACERVFLGALILANKYLNDSTLKNLHWALCTGVFGKRDIGRIEREFLAVLDWDLNIHEADLLAHHDALIALTHPHRHQSHRHIPRTSARASSHSRWSDDSSDMDVDSVSSFESISLPRTPETHAAVPFPTSKPQSLEPPHLSHSPEHKHRSSAMSILHSFPIPKFASSYAQHAREAMPAVQVFA